MHIIKRKDNITPLIIFFLLVQGEPPPHPPPPAKVPPTKPAPPAMGGAPAGGVWTITPQDRARYDTIFNTLGPEANKLHGSKVCVCVCVCV